ncbi:MAG: membrane protein insertase YidC, partial [Gemmataceae bacterium]
MQPQPQQQPPPATNLLFFMLLAFLILVGFQQIRDYIYPPPPAPAKKGDDPAADKAGKDKPNFRLAELPPPLADDAMVVLGDENTTLRAVLDPRGAGVRRVTVNTFRAADQDAKPTNDPLDLVPADANTDEPAHLLYHFDGPDAKRPVDTLGTVRWQTKGVEKEQVNGEEVKVVRFTATAGGLRYTKKFSLAPGDYHLGLEVTVERPASEKGKARARYQLVGAKGLPIEGKWFASKFRNAVIGLEDDKTGWIERDFQELPKIVLWGSGNSIGNTDTSFLRYAGVECQYFASVIVVSDDQVAGQDRKFLTSARPTLESGVVHGRVKKGDALVGVRDRINVVGNDGRQEVVFLDPRDEKKLEGLTEASGPIAIVYRN